MTMKRLVLLSTGIACLAACSGASTEEATGNGVSLRNLTEGDVATNAAAGYAIEGDLVPTPSDAATQHYLLRVRGTVTGTVVAITREEKGGRIAYARSEVDCAKRQFHVLGVGPRRSVAETATAPDGPLRSIDGLPLRRELASAICRRNGTPLATAS